MGEFEAVEILLVEDSEADAEMTIRAMKKRNLSNRIIWLKDGAEALDFIFCTGVYSERQSGNPKLILLDIKMPKVDGLQVLTRLKSDERTKAIPVVMLTSSAEGPDIDESYKIGANSYLVKPVGFTEFMEVVSQASLYWTVMNKVTQ
ncbi:MAG: response regulator [Pseudomonadota bacterium]